MPVGVRLTSLPVSTAVERTGSIEFKGEAAELLQKINDATLNSGLSNLNSVPTDCPTRERRGYLGDGQIASDTMSSFFSMAATYRHFLHVIMDSQNPVGAVPAKTPPYPPSLYYNNDAGWTVAYPLIVRLMLQRYNDTATVSKHFPHLLKLWSNVSSYVPKNGEYKDLWVDVDQDGTFINGDLGDWAASRDEWPFDPTLENQAHTPSALIATFWLIQFAEAMEQLATTLGHSSVLYEQQASASRAALHSRFWNVTSRRYYVLGREPPRSTERFKPNEVHHPPAQTLQALPLWAGNITPPSLHQAAVAALVQSLEVTDHHLLTGIVGTKFILPALAENGKLDVAMKILTHVTQPSFGFMVSQNLTTLMESWRSDATHAFGSKNHIMFGSESAFLMEHVAGIRLSGAGRVVIAPQPDSVSQLTEVTAVLELEGGEVAMAWRREDGGWRLDARTPPGVLATVRLPLPATGGTITESATVLWSWDDGLVEGSGAPRARIVITAAGEQVLDIEQRSGSYEYVVRHCERPLK